MRIGSPAGAQRVRQGARSADAGAPAPPPNCATQDVRRRNTALPALAWTWPFLLAACAPGERLGVVEQGVCVCPERARDLLEAEHARGARKAELVTMGMWLVYQSRAGSVRRIARGLYEVAS